MQQTRARAGLEFLLLPQNVRELEGQSNIAEIKQIISYTKSSYLPVLTGVSRGSRYIYDERRNTEVIQALMFHSYSYSSVLQQSTTRTRNGFTFADFRSPKVLRASEMPALNSLTGALNLPAVKVSSYNEDPHQLRDLCFGTSREQLCWWWQPPPPPVSCRLLSQQTGVLQAPIHIFLKPSSNCFHLCNRRPASPTGISRCYGNICCPIICWWIHKLFEIGE